MQHAIASDPIMPLSELGVLICSKDRAWQLQQLLASIKYSQTDLPSDQQCKFHQAVIYTYSTNEHATAYQRVKEEYSEVRFILESDPIESNSSTVDSSHWSCIHGVDSSTSSTSSAKKDAVATSSSTPFADHVFRTIERWRSIPTIRHIMFGVDDMLFYDHAVPFQKLLTLLDQPSEQRVLTIQLALHPQITFCHPANRAARKPATFTPGVLADSPSTSDSPSDSLQPLRFTRSQCDCDWNYPFSLCGSIYRMSDVVDLLTLIEQLKGRSSMNHPNSFEVVGNQIMTTGSKMQGRMAAGLNCTDFSPSNLLPIATQRPFSYCLSRPVMSVITINRVQDLFANPIYDSSKPNTMSKAMDNSSAPSLALDSPTTSSTTHQATQHDESHPVSVDLSADELLNLWLKRPSLVLDVNRYRIASKEFNSVHIGEFFTKEETA